MGLWNTAWLAPIDHRPSERSHWSIKKRGIAAFRGKRREMYSFVLFVCVLFLAEYSSRENPAWVFPDLRVKNRLVVWSSQALAALLFPGYSFQPPIDHENWLELILCERFQAWVVSIALWLDLLQSWTLPPINHFPLPPTTRNRHEKWSASALCDGFLFQESRIAFWPNLLWFQSLSWSP